MEEGRTRTLVLGDARGTGRCLRVTWHRNTSTVVFSHWNGSICAASTPVRLDDATRVIELLITALRDAADTAAREGSTAAAAEARSVVDRLRRRLRPVLAPVLPLSGPSSEADRDSG